MKKFLLATTALAGFSGAAAAAELAVSMAAEFGISNRGAIAATDVNTATGAEAGEASAASTSFHQGYTITFRGTGETDGGLAFGASTRLDMDDSSEENQNPLGDSGTVFISGAFGRLTMGDTDGGFDWALDEFSFISNVTDEYSTHAGWDGHAGFDGRQDDQVLRYEYTMGDMSLAASYEQAENGANSDISDSIGLGLRYNMAMGATSIRLGVGYQTGSRNQIDTAGDDAGEAGDAADSVNGSAIGGSITASMENGLTLGLNYASYSYDDTDIADADSLLEDYTSTSVAVSYTTGAMTIAANWGRLEYETAANDSDGWGAGVNYDLGGGAVVQAGMFDDGYSVGLAMSF